MVANGGGFETLLVWQRAHELVRAVYRLSSTFPKFELYALGDQMRRSSVSIAANIAEAYSRRSPKDKLRFLNMSRGSLEETRYFLAAIWAMGMAGMRTHCLRNPVSCFDSTKNRSEREQKFR